MYVVSYANSFLKFTKFGHQTHPDRPPSRAQNPLKIGPGWVQRPPVIPSAPQERQKSTKEVPQNAPRALQERPGPPQERPEEAQEPPKSGPERAKVSPRWLREPIQERSQDFAKFAFSYTRERDSEGSRRPRERPRSSQIASRSLSRATLGAQVCSRSPVESPVERLGAAKLTRGACRGESGGPSGASGPEAAVR